MNLTLHHFRNEVRHLLPRWWSWMVLLALELMINLEWLAPLRTGEGEWLTTAPCMITFGVALLLTTSCTPENSPAANGSFIATRPLPLSSYWAARVLVFLVMIVLPLAAREALYLMFSQRPISAVLAGAAEQALSAIGLYGWLVPFTALWRGWRKGAALAALPMVLLFATMLTDFLHRLLLNQYMNGFLLTEWHPGLGVAVIAMLSLLAWVHHRRPLGMPVLLGCVFVLCMGLTLLGAYWRGPNAVETPVNQARAEEIARAAHLRMQDDGYEMFRVTEMVSRKPVLQIQALPAAGALPPDIDFSLKTNASTVHANGQTLHTVNRQMFVGNQRFSPYQLLGQGAVSSRSRAVAHNLPAGTLLSLGYYKRNQGDGSRGGMDVAVVAEPLPFPDLPVSVDADFDVRWEDWHTSISMPVRAHATASNDRQHWSILGVRWNQDASGAAKAGAVCVDYRVEWQGDGDLSSNVKVMLHAPGRQLAWIGGSEESPVKGRAYFTSWRRAIHTVCWHDVLNYADGEPAPADKDTLQFIVLEPRLLGTTRWAWHSPELKSADYVNSGGPLEQWQYPYNDVFYRGRELKAFGERVAALPAPAAASSSQDVIRYLWDVLETGSAVQLRGKEAMARVAELVGAVARDHPDVMLGLPATVGRGWQDVLTPALAPFITDAHKAEILRRLPLQPWLAGIVRQKGWARESVPALDDVLRSNKTLDSELRDMLLTVDDDRVRHRILADFRQHPGYDFNAVESLVKVPSMLPDLKRTGAELWRGFLPTLHDSFANRLRLEIMFGNAEALDLALRLAGLCAEENGADYQSPLVFELPELTGLPQPAKNAAFATLAPQYRHLSAGDFIYLPDQLRWQKKP